MKKITISLSLIVTLFLVLISPCYAQQAVNSLIGKWIFPIPDEGFFIFEFTNREIIFIANGEREKVNYRTRNNTIFVDNKAWMDYEFVNNTLKLIDTNNRSQVMTGRRYATERVTALNGRFNLNGDSEGISTIEFIDNKYLRLKMTDHNFYVGAEYEINNNRLIVRTGSYMFIFDIINDSMLLNGDSLFVKE